MALLCSHSKKTWMKELNIIDIVDSIISLEWEFSNQSDTLSCPCDFEAFQWNRANYLNALTAEILENYYQDLRNAQGEGRNPISEKRKYLMEQTASSQLRGQGGETYSLEKEYLLEWISQVLAMWQESLAQEYPRLIGKRTPIKRDRETGVQPSFETMMRCELAACSIITLRSYAAYVEKLQKTGGNLNQMIWEKIVVRCGYSSLKEAESQLRRGA